VCKLANRHPMQQQLAQRLVLAIMVTSEDASGVYPSPISSAPTGLTLLAGSSNQFVPLGTSAVPIAAYQFTLNPQSRANARVTLVLMQAGIG
jgi:hypothetical protein